MPIVEFSQPGLNRQHSHHQSPHRQNSSSRSSLLNNHQGPGSYGSLDRMGNSFAPGLPDNIAVKVREKISDL